MNIDLERTLSLLSTYLRKKNESRSFTICGGASMVFRGIRGRETEDIDIISPKIDQALHDASVQVANDLHLKHGWLNDKAHQIFADDLPTGWESRVFDVFTASHLRVQSISNFDLAALKFLAECDRQKDFQDLVELNLSESDIEQISRHALSRNPGDVEDWPSLVAVVENKLRRKMGYEGR